MTCSGFKYPTALAGSMRECSCPKYKKEVYNIEPESEPIFQLPKELEVTVGAEVTADAEVSSGGALRYNKGKPQFSHLSPDFIMEMMTAMTKANDKYGYLNWAKAQEVRTASDSLMRHFLKFQQGADVDEELGVHHLALVAVNAMIIFQNLQDFGDKVDNRFSKAKDEVQGES